MVTSNNTNELQAIGQTTLQFASFENAKKQLRTFSNRNSEDFGIKEVAVDGGFLGLGDHKVTGAELNKVTSQVKDHLIKINSFSKDVVKEIGHVYDALESLDKEYIPAILTAVKGAEVASNQAKEASEHARVAQEDIKKTIEKQRKIVGVLEKHKEKLDKLIHLENIDDIWKMEKELEKEMAEFQKNFSEAQEQLSNFEKSIKSLQSFANSVLDYEHLEEIDEIWERVGDAETNIDSLVVSMKEANERIESILHLSHINDLDYMWDELANRENDINSLEKAIATQEEKMSSTEQDIQILFELKKRLDNIKHISDTDDMWSDVQKSKDDISISEKKITLIEQSTSNLTETTEELLDYRQKLSGITHLFDIDEINDALFTATQKIDELNAENQKQNELIREQRLALEAEHKQNNENTSILKNKLKIAYFISGSAVGLTILQFILSIVGVI